MLRLSFDSSPAAAPLWIVGGPVPPGDVVYFHSIDHVTAICIGPWMSKWQKLWFELDDVDTFFFQLVTSTTSHLSFMFMSAETFIDFLKDTLQLWFVLEKRLKRIDMEQTSVLGRMKAIFFL